MEKFKY